MGGWEKIADLLSHLSALEGAQGFGLGVSANGVEDSVVPATCQHDALLRGRAAAGCLVKAPCEVAAGGHGSNDNGGFQQRRNKPENLRQVRSVVHAVGGIGVSVTVHFCFPGKVLLRWWFLRVGDL